MITTSRMTAKKKNVLSKEDKVLNIFIPNKNEERLLRQESYRRKLAVSAAKAIDRYFEDMKHKSLF